MKEGISTIFGKRFCPVKSIDNQICGCKFRIHRNEFHCLSALIITWTGHFIKCQNFGRDAKAWGEWYEANREFLGKDMPKFDAALVDWTCGSDNAEIKQWSDPKVQEENDNRWFER